jgi:hypothetical protein
MITLAFAIATSGTGGCRGVQTYDGPRLPKSEVAHLGVAIDQCSIVQFDGHDIDDFAFALGDGLEMTAGSHSVTLEIFWRNYWHEQVTVDFTAAAQHDYVARAWDTTHIGMVRGATEFMAGLPTVIVAGPVLAGDRFLHPAHARPEGACLWIEDTHSGEVVGGTPPPTQEDKP